MIAGTLLACLAIAIPFFLHRVRSNPSLAAAIATVFVIRQAISIGQVYFHGLPTVNLDPIEFHTAAKTNYGPLSRDPYGQFLGAFYTLFGPSQFLGCQLSQVAFAVSLVVIIELTTFFHIERSATRIVLIFGLLPSCALNTSVTSREAFQMMAFLLLCLGVLRTVRDGMGIATALVPISAALLVTLQQGFGLLILLILPLAGLWIAREQPKAILVILVVSGAVLLSLGPSLWSFLASHSTVVQRLEQGEALDYIDGYQESVERGRSDFGVFLDLSSPWSAARTGPQVLLSYLFAPFPWQIDESIDVFGAVESFLRLYLVAGAVKTIRKTTRAPRSHKLLAFAMFATTEVMWAAGTSNWGTAFRHRVVAYGLLVILGAGTFGDGERSATNRRRTTKSARARIRERRRRRYRGTRPAAQSAREKS